MAEIKDDELQVLRGSKVLLDKLLSGETRRATERLIKKHHPETSTIDDLVAEDKKEITDQISELSKDFKEFKKSLTDSKLEDKFQEDIRYLMQKEDFTEEGIEKLKKMMIERQIPNIRDAAAVWNQRNPPKPQEPSIMAPTDWGFGRKTEDPDLKLLFEDEDAWAEKEARKAWAEETVKKGQILT